MPKIALSSSFIFIFFHYYFVQFYQFNYPSLHENQNMWNLVRCTVNFSSCSTGPHLCALFSQVTKLSPFYIIYLTASTSIIEHIQEYHRNYHASIILLVFLCYKNNNNDMYRTFRVH